MRRILALGIGLAASAVYLAVTTRSLTWDSLHSAAGSVVAWPVLVHVAAFALVMRARAERLALSLSDRQPLRWHQSLPSQMAGYVSNLVLPLQAGELARVAVASRGLGLPAATVVSAIALERVIDLLIAFASFSLASLWIPGVSAAVRQAAALAGLGVSMGAAVLLWAAWYPGSARHILARITLPLPDRLRAGLLRQGEAALEGVALLREAGRAQRYAFWCLMQWIGWVGSVATTLWAVQLNAGPAAWVLTSALSTLALVLPAGPAYLGSFQLAYQLALSPLGIPPAAGFLAATLLQTCTVVLVLCTAAAVAVANRPAPPEPPIASP